MESVEGKVAVVTGGGSGIGRGMALAFADAGMHVVVADIEQASAEAVGEEVAARGVRALAVRTDVADRAAVETLAEKSFAEMGAVHVLCNNAGVSVFGPLDQMSDADWRWVLSVNLEGVIHGLQAFLPRLRAQRQGGHVVNTASMAGQFTAPGLGVYSATKFAVVGLSEALRLDLTPHGIGVSVLCPGFVRTRIVESGRNRPGHLGGPEPAPTGMPNLIEKLGTDPLEVGRKVLAAVRANQLYVFTHPDMKLLLEARFRTILAAFDAAAQKG